MIHYTDNLNTLIRDIVARVEPLSFIDPDRLLVFGRVGRTGAAGAYATCHSLNLPPSDPGYYFWRDRATGEMTRRSEWFVTKSPELVVDGRTVDYMLSFSLPRFCDQSLHRSRKAIFYPGEPAWIAKLDTVIHELYHISPSDSGLRRFERADGETSARYHSADFFHQVSSLVREYLATHPSASTYGFLRHDFSGLETKYGSVLGTTFRTFPSYPQRFPERLAEQPPAPLVKTEPIRSVTQPTRYTEDHLCVRQFFREGGRQPRCRCDERIAA